MEGRRGFGKGRGSGILGLEDRQSDLKQIAGEESGATDGWNSQGNHFKSDGDDSGWNETPAESRGGFGFKSGGFGSRNRDGGDADRNGFGKRGGGGFGGFRGGNGDENANGGGGFKRGGFGGGRGGGGGFGRRNDDGDNEEANGFSEGGGGGFKRGGFGGGRGGGGGFGRRNDDGDNEDGSSEGGGFRRGGFRGGRGGDGERRGGFRGGRGGGFGSRGDNEDGDNADSSEGGFRPRGGRGGGRGGGFGRRGGDDDDSSGGGFKRGGFGNDDGEGGDEDGGGFRGRGRGRGGRGGGRGRGRDGDSDDGPRGGGFGASKDGEDGEDGITAPKEHYIPPEPAEDEETMYSCIPSGCNFDKYENISVNVSGENPPKAIQTFESAGLSQLLLENIKKSHYIKPTPVQKYSIPIVSMKRDLMACAQTGSGKTAAFLVPIINDLIKSNASAASFEECQTPQVVIVSPTRELALQIFNEARKFSNGSILRGVVSYGGTSTFHQMDQLKKGCNILVATPGRLHDFVNRGRISFADCRYLVLDEADRMLDMGFLPEIRKIFQHETMPSSETRRTLMFSATFPEDIQRLASEFLQNYLFLVVGTVGAANEDVTQTFYQVGKFEKKDKLKEIVEQAGNERVLVFVDQKRTADFVATYLSADGKPTTSIHGDRLQSQREEALRDFRSGHRPILIATAVAARGLDIKDVSYVVNFDLPKEIDEYVHRIGRTGRVGNTGKAISFYDTESDRALAASLVKTLEEAQQEVPEWLKDEAQGQRSNYSNAEAKDIRSGGNEWSNSNSGFGTTPAAEEDSWE